MKINKYLIIVILTFFLIEIFSQFTYGIGDDSVYFYMGKLVSDGQIPYKDFFYAHPPLQLLFYGIIFKVLPYNLHTFKLFFILLTIVNSLLLYFIVKKDLGQRIAELSITMLLFAPTVLFNASFEFGLTIALFFFLLALNQERSSFKQISLFLLSSMYRFHILFLIIGYTGYKMYIGQGKYLKRFVWSLNWFLIVNGLLTFMLPNYFQDTILYHLNKPESQIQTFSTIITIIKMNWLIFLLPLILVLFYIKNISSKIMLYLLIPIPFLLYLAKTIFFGYYFVLIIPFIAVIAAYVVYKINHRLIYIIFSFFVGLNALNYLSLSTNTPHFDIKQGELITGDPSIISYMALNGNYKVMNNDVDINSMRFEAGLYNMTYFITGLMIQHPSVIIKQDEGIYARNKEFRDYINKDCSLKQIIQDYKLFKC